MPQNTGGVPPAPKQEVSFKSESVRAAKLGSCTRRNTVSEQSNKPVKEFRVSGGISAAVWRNTATVDGRPVVRHSVKFQKRYRDKKKGEWADSLYFHPRDLPLLRLVIDRAFAYVSTAQGSAEDADDPAAHIDSNP